jgi:hypothetical protein
MRPSKQRLSYSRNEDSPQKNTVGGTFSVLEIPKLDRNFERILAELRTNLTMPRKNYDILGIPPPRGVGKAREA